MALEGRRSGGGGGNFRGASRSTSPTTPTAASPAFSRQVLAFGPALVDQPKGLRAAVIGAAVPAVPPRHRWHAPVSVGLPSLTMTSLR
jgi:hypothetical protein